VLVSSRPHPELPTDIPIAHPLRATAAVALEPFPGATQLQALALQEIDHLKARDPDDLALTVLGVLTAAAGPLTVDDLATLAAAPGASTLEQKRRIRRLVTVDAARSLQPVGPETGRRYQFAHATLLQRAKLLRSRRRAVVEVGLARSPPRAGPSRPGSGRRPT
jgi:hypothetical protein